MSGPPAPSGLPPAYESGQYNPDAFQTAYDESGTSASNEQANLLRGDRDGGRRHSSDTDISSLLEGSDDEESSAVRREMEEMDVEEPRHDGPDQSFPRRASMASRRIAYSISTKLMTPVQRFLDPLATFTHSMNVKFDAFISRFGNPLILKRLLYLFFVFLLIFVAFQAGVLPGSAKDAFVGGGEYHDPETLFEFLRDSIRPELMESRLEYLSSMPHLAGTEGDLALAKYVQEELTSFGMKQVGLTEHLAYITYPNETESSITLELLGDKPFKASMKEDAMYPNPSSSQAQPKPFHGFSAAGQVEGPVVYANFGTKQDFEQLRKQGISIEGAIVFMKTGKMATGLKVLLAQQAGAVGVVTFSDRPYSEAGMWPDGPDYPPGAVERESMAITAMVPGDLLSPGYSSITTPRVIGEDQVTNLPKIPAVPVSWNDAKPFLSAIQNLGVEMQGSNMPHLDSWWSGNLSSPHVTLSNYPIVKERHPIWNVLSRLDGREQADFALIIGAKRDAWCYGAAGAMSGTSVLLELARVFTLMSTKLKWTPLRTIYFASWDGGDQNLAGTTEWVEYNIDTLRSKGAVYIDLEDAVSGGKLDIRGHPILSSLVKHVLEEVKDPISNRTYGLDFEGVKPLDEPGNYLPFLSYAGVPSIQLGFKGDVYPKHSCFDSIEWMKKYGDSDFSFHTTLVDILSKLVMNLADSPILPLDLSTYSDAIDEYTRDLENYAHSQPTWESEGAGIFDISVLHGATNKIRQIHSIFLSFRNDWTILTSNQPEPPGFIHMRRSWNTRLLNFDHMLLEGKSIMVDRPWFKHPVFGPQLWHPTEGQYLWGTFPGIRDRIERQDWAGAKEIVGVTGAQMEFAASHINQSL